MDYAVFLAGIVRFGPADFVVHEVVEERVAAEAELLVVWDSHLEVAHDNPIVVVVSARFT